MVTKIRSSNDRLSPIGNISWKLEEPNPAMYHDDTGIVGTIRPEQSNSTGVYRAFERSLYNVLDKVNDLKSVFQLAVGEHFEDGMESNFSLAVEQFILHNGYEGVLAFGLVIHEQLFNENYIAEALSWIGDLDDPTTRVSRRIVLETALTSESFLIRDSAISALSYLGDPNSIIPLEKLLKEERSKAVCTNIEVVLRYLRTLPN